MTIVVIIVVGMAYFLGLTFDAIFRATNIG